MTLCRTLILLHVVCHELIEPTRCSSLMLFFHNIVVDHRFSITSTLGATAPFLLYPSPLIPQISPPSLCLHHTSVTLHRRFLTAIGGFFWLSRWRFLRDYHGGSEKREKMEVPELSQRLGRQPMEVLLLSDRRFYIRARRRFLSRNGGYPKVQRRSIDPRHAGGS